jgi:formylglycine-generating enzyme required for sulfatase activity
MPGKIFVNYRRDDERAMAARIRDWLAAKFGDANVFMDVDNLLAGQRFDKELEEAFAQTDVFLAVIGPRWVELLAERQASAERDYVREEIAGALHRGVFVIPVLIERTPLPRADALPEDIRNLVLHQKHVVTHEQFGRDIAALVEAIRSRRKVLRAKAADRWFRVVDAAFVWGGAALVAALLLWAALAYLGAPVWTPDWEDLRAKLLAEVLEGRLASPKAKTEAEANKRGEDEAERQRLAMLKAEQDRKLAEEGSRRDAALSVKPGSGESFRDCDVCPEMVVVPGGTFIMGSPPFGVVVLESGHPQRNVTIAQPFAVGKFEVTFAEWDACVAASGCKHRPGDEGWERGRRPVINVSWHDTKEYVVWLSRKTGKTYRLLSEAEWEYTARAGTTTYQAFGDEIGRSQARYYASKTAEVGSFPANKFGLHDLHGNVREWVEDAWHPNYQGAPSDGSVWQGGNTTYRVLRGGCWYDSPVSIRSDSRGKSPPDSRNFGIGFRVARTS